MNQSWSGNCTIEFPWVDQDTFFAPTQDCFVESSNQEDKISIFKILHSAILVAEISISVASINRDVGQLKKDLHYNHHKLIQRASLLNTETAFDLAQAYLVGIRVEDEQFCTEVSKAIVKTTIEASASCTLASRWKKGTRHNSSAWRKEATAKFFEDAAMASLGIYQGGESKRIADEIKEMIHLARRDSMGVEGA
ncbi:hypothetical protein GGP41_008782 [Bipolaris sorokiniana]|uniref:Uncharacterized protein n=1 Tax=Cochliobolus sativus TaxID=45130 RepID=A0A8H6DRA9_COCSA|nr:hypothetical protein GGP41_008782 [Bipolaris sorokiniana]